MKEAEETNLSDATQPVMEEENHCWILALQYKVQEVDARKTLMHPRAELQLQQAYEVATFVVWAGRRLYPSLSHTHHLSCIWMELMSLLE